MNKFLAGVAAVAAAAGIAYGGYQAVQTPVACGCNVVLANEWVSTSGNDSDAARHSSRVADPGGTGDFATVGAAVAAASPGDTVSVDCGSYSAQTIASYAGSAPAVVVAAVTPGCVTVASLTVAESSYVALRDIQSTGAITVANTDDESCGSSGYTNVAFVDDTGTVLYVQGSVSNTRVLNSTFGPSIDNHSAVGPYNGGWPAPCGVYVQGSTFTVQASGTNGVHTEAFQLQDGSTEPSNIDLQSNVFNGPTNTVPYDTITASLSTAGADGLTEENNFVYGVNGLILGYDSVNVLVENNTVQDGIDMVNTQSACATFTSPCGPFTFIGNLVGAWTYSTCVANSGYTGVSTYAYNVGVNDGGGGVGDCAGATGDQILTNGTSLDFVGPTLNIGGGSPAIGAGDPSLFPATNIYGATRTSPPNAGAD